MQNSTVTFNKTLTNIEEMKINLMKITQILARTIQTSHLEETPKNLIRQNQS